MLVVLSVQNLTKIIFIYTNNEQLEYERMPYNPNTAQEHVLRQEEGSNQRPTCNLTWTDC
jgi:hypothetical protein